jgi:hypothetical protein
MIKHLFFLSNFDRAGAFTVTLRAKGKQPELFNPVTGEIKKIACYEQMEDGTKIEIDVQDRADSFFVVFREKAVSPSVVKVSIPVNELDLFYNEKSELIAKTGKAGIYALTFSDASMRTVRTGDGTAKPEKKTPLMVISKAVYGVPDDPQKQVDVSKKVQAFLSAGERGIIVNNELAGRDPAFGILKRLMITYSLEGETYEISAAENETLKLPVKVNGAGTVLLDILGWKTEATDDGYTETRSAEFDLPNGLDMEQREILDL